MSMFLSRIQRRADRAKRTSERREQNRREHQCNKRTNTSRCCCICRQSRVMRSSLPHIRITLVSYLSIKKWAGFNWRHYFECSNRNSVWCEQYWIWIYHASGSGSDHRCLHRTNLQWNCRLRNQCSADRRRSTGDHVQGGSCRGCSSGIRSVLRCWRWEFHETLGSIHRLSLWRTPIRLFRWFPAARSPITSRCRRWLPKRRPWSAPSPAPWPRRASPGRWWLPAGPRSLRRCPPAARPRSPARPAPARCRSRRPSCPPSACRPTVFSQPPTRFKIWT